MKWVWKLIQLLREFDDENWNMVHFENYIYAQDYLIISKKFGFIQWLVENDKIDFYNILKENWTFRKEFYAIENRKEYERLIMLLSVSDKPIDFLCRILK